MGFGQGTGVLVRTPVRALSKRFLPQQVQESIIPASYGYCQASRGTTGSVILSIT